MASTQWDTFRELYCRVPALGLSLDVSKMVFPSGFFDSMTPAMREAFSAMAELERGAVANPDEDRMVGHYWLRDPSLAPNRQIRGEIESTLKRIKEFVAGLHEGGEFHDVLSIGIGGSALGPMFVADALGSQTDDVMTVEFIDNTDPDGIARIVNRFLDLDEVITIVTSKSGGTPETYNGMRLIREAYEEAEVDFAKHAVAITMPGSKLDKLAESEGWLARFPMFDWVGGRTSELSSVGLLPAALQGIDIDAMLEGARLCDEATRSTDVRANPAALLALSWYHATGGKGKKDMVILPYKDRLLLLSRYLQQLVMESLGKRENLKGEVVEQGISVYGNKGSTDQHAYVQQLRDGVNNFFAVFVRVLEDGGSALEVSDGATAGDYLHGFLLGTRAALAENGRGSVTITVPRVDARSVGALIALFERAVGFYASLVGINAYHQPGVEAGKKAAAGVLELQDKVLKTLTDVPQTAEQIAGLAGTDDVETTFLVLEHAAANGRARIDQDGPPAEMTFLRVGE